jgi:hypothetical protein
MSNRADSRRKAHRLARPESLEPRLALAAAPVNPNTGSIVASQFQPYGYSLLGTQFTEVTAGGGASLQLTAPNNSGSPPAPPTNYGYPSAAVNTGLISGSQVNVGGFTTLGLQLQDTTLSGALRVDLLDEGIGKPAAGGTQPVPVGGAHTLPLMVPPGSPGVVTNSGVIISSQFNDGGFGPLGIQASGLNVGGGLSIVSRNTIGSPDVPVTPAVIPFASPAQAMPVNAGTIRDSQFADGGFGDTGLQLRGVSVGGSLDVRAERLLIQPTTSPANVGPPALVGRLNVNTRVVMLTKPPGTSAPATSMLFPGMLVTGGGIPANTVIASIIGPARITLSKLPRQTTTSRLTFFTPSSPTNTGSIVSSQVADGGFGDIGLQWSNVTVGGRVATLHSGLEIQPEVDYVSAITTGPRQFGQPITPASTAPPAGPAPAIPLTGATPTAGAGAPAVGGTSATNSGTIVASQFADGGFGDIGMQWQNVRVTGSVEATHNALSIQPENNGQGQISVAAVSFATSPPPVAPGVAGSGGPLPSMPLITTPGTPVTPPLPAPTNPGGTGSVTNSATNSGLVSASQFADGGFGDVGLQWSNVTVQGDVQVVHNSLSIQPTGSALAGVSVQNVTFGSGTAPAGDPRLRPVTLQTLTVNSSGAAGPPPFVPDSMFARTANTADLNGRQFLSAPAGATSLQWQWLTRDASGFVIVNNVLQVSNTGTAGTAAGAQAGPITLNRITFPGSLPPTGPASRPVAAAAPANPAAKLAARLAARTAARPAARPAATIVRGIMLPASRGGASVTAATRQATVNAASNSGRLQSNQFLDGGTGDIGLQWRGVTVNGSVRIEHNTLAVNVVSDATGTWPVLVSGIRFDSGWAAFGAASDILRLTPVVAATAPAARPTATATSAVNSSNGASNSGVLTRGQFLDGGMGQIGLQWQQVTINCPIRIVNNVLSVTVSGTNTRGVVVQDVTFV